MDLREFAQTVLYGSTLEEKLLSPDLELFRAQEATSLSCQALASPPRYPGRPFELSLERREKACFPELSKIHQDQTRGEILHFFANHELLALELMALMLLRFPEAPSPFRMGIVGTMLEEQGHLRLYLERMRELGVRFGDLPVSAYFWHTLSGMSSPLDYVTQMSLTFEQANLDFSLFYRDAVSKTGDAKTTEVLDRVYREEIGHVKHGLEWFNRWRKEDANAPAEESDWEAYKRLLPSPLTPRRAKGEIFDRKARAQAGFSELYIRELELFSGAKGRPPVLWHYNPFCDAEIARGKPGFSAKSVPQRMAEDLEHLPMFLASHQDVVLVSKRPSLAWLQDLKAIGFELPDWWEKPLSEIREPKFGGFEPWGWSPEAFAKFSPLKDRLVPTSGGNAPFCESLFSHSHFEETRIGELFSKSFSAQFLKTWASQNPELDLSLSLQKMALGKVFSDWQEARSWASSELRQQRRLVAKAPLSTSGNGVRRLLSADELNGALGGWIKNTISDQGSIVIEPWLEKVSDLSIQLEIEDSQTRLLEFKRFIVGKQFEYRGTLLGPARDSFDASSLSLLHRVLPQWKILLRDLGSTLREKGFRGSVGVDAMIYRIDGELHFKPLVEINPRWTMGRVALALEDHLLPGKPAAWIFLPAQAPIAELLATYPVRTQKSDAGIRIESGVIPTQDPARAQEVMTLLFVGEEAFQAAKKQLEIR